jgi:hypothetical protein
MQIPVNLNDRIYALQKAAPDLPQPLVHLFALLPEPGTEFSAYHREQFLKALTCICAMVYGQVDPIKIEVKGGDSSRQERSDG